MLAASENVTRTVLRSDGLPTIVPRGLHLTFMALSEDRGVYHEHFVCVFGVDFSWRHEIEHGWRRAYPERHRTSFFSSAGSA